MPVAFLVITLGLKKYPAVAIGVGIVGGAGAAYLLAVLVRHVGRLVEPALWESWGGAPTTQLLRTRDTGGNPVERDAWRIAVEDVTGLTLLSPSQEATNNIQADQTIEAAIGQLRRLGQDSRYPLVKAENIQYGFERNFYGLRWVGRTNAFVCTAALIGALAAGPLSIGGTRVSAGAVIAGVLIDAAIFIGWCLLPSAKRTKHAADRYARQLLQAVTSESRS